MRWVVLSVLFLIGCGRESVEVQSNGDLGAFHLRAADAACATTLDRLCACPGGVTSNLIMGRHEVQVVRWLRVFSSNGLGDSNTVSEYEPLEDARIQVDSDAARVESVERCADGVHFVLTIDRLETFTLSASTEDLSDRWAIQPRSTCACE